MVGVLRAAAATVLAGSLCLPAWAVNGLDGSSAADGGGALVIELVERGSPNSAGSNPAAARLGGKATKLHNSIQSASSSSCSSSGGNRMPASIWRAVLPLTHFL